MSEDLIALLQRVQGRLLSIELSVILADPLVLKARAAFVGGRAFEATALVAAGGPVDPSVAADAEARAKAEVIREYLNSLPAEEPPGPQMGAGAPPDRERPAPPDASTAPAGGPTCERCGQALTPFSMNGVTYTPEDLAERRKKRYGGVLCSDCVSALRGAGKKGQGR